MDYEDASVDDLQEMYDTTLRTLLDKHAPCRTVRRRHQPTTPWFERIAPQSSVGQERSNSVIEGLGWLVIGWLGRRRPRRSIDCTDGNRVNSGKGNH